MRNLCIHHYANSGLYLYASNEEILKIDASGLQTRSDFDARKLKSAASFYGFSSGYADALLADGFTTDDAEEMLYRRSPFYITVR